MRKARTQVAGGIDGKARRSSETQTDRGDQRTYGNGIKAFCKLVGPDKQNRERENQRGENFTENVISP